MSFVLFGLALWVAFGALGWTASVALRVRRPDPLEWAGAIFPGILIGPISFLLAYRAAVELMKPYRRPWFVKRKSDS